MTLPTFLAHVAARWAVTRTPPHGWVPDESEIEMTERTYTREDMARAWDEGAEVAWANTTPQWNGHTHAPQFLPFCEANYDIDNPYEREEA